MKKKVGRNEFCPCGSGRKAKNCCGVGGPRRTIKPGILTSGWTIIGFMVVCAAGISILWYQTHSGVDPRLVPPPLSAGTGGSGSPLSSSDNDVLSPSKSLLEKTSYTDIPGIDLETLTGEQRKTILARVNVEKCSCGCGYTIAGCRHLDTTCGISLPMARQIVADVTGS